MSAQIFSNGDGRVRRYENAVYWQAARHDERLALRRVISHYYYEDRKITGQEARSVAGDRGLGSFGFIEKDPLSAP